MGGRSQERREIAGCPAGLGDGEEAGQWKVEEVLLGSIQQLRQGDSVKAPGGKVAALGQVTSRILGTLTSATWSSQPSPWVASGHPSLMARSSPGIGAIGHESRKHTGIRPTAFTSRMDGEQIGQVPVQAEGEGLPGTSSALGPCPRPSSALSLSGRTTWTPSPASATMASRVCSFWASSPSWLPWPSPP